MPLSVTAQMCFLAVEQLGLKSFQAAISRESLAGRGGQERDQVSQLFIRHPQHATQAHLQQRGPGHGVPPVDLRNVTMSPSTTS